MTRQVTPISVQNFKAKRSKRQKKRLTVIIVSFALGVVLMAFKLLAFRLTHSSAVLSDALESIINIVASAFAAISVWMAAKPPDSRHPYGHGKIENFSAGFEGALIIIAAVGIFYTGIQHLLHPHKITHIKQGSVILISASLVNLLMGMLLIRMGRQTNSIALTADGKHLLADVYTTVGVLIGLGLTSWSGWIWIDGAVACLVGINILVTGGRLLMQSSARLMDASDPELLDHIAGLIQKHRSSNWVDIHQLRAWQAGSHVHIDLHLVLDGKASLEKTHQEAKALENMLINELQGEASVLVHTDPCDSSDCPVCRHTTCSTRSHTMKNKDQWDRKRLTKTRKHHLTTLSKNN
ncbi:MAG: cation transporter [Desulfobacteraceae bacterium]|nr:cation transporter [Desulfobacteraceae bacterium]